MISKKLSARRLFERLLKQECLRTLWAGGIFTITMIFALPVGAALDLGQYSDKLYNIPDNFLVEFMTQNDMFFSMIFIMSGFAALLEFGYLFNRSKVDFYHSLPISRGMQFLYRYVTGFLLFAVPYVILYGSAVLVGIAHGAMIVGYVRELAVLAFVYLVFYWILYSVSIIAVLFAGSLLSSIMTLLVVHFAGPVFCMLVKECQIIFFDTYVDSGRPLLYGSGSAITICVEMLERYEVTGYYEIFSIGILTAMAVLLPLAACALFLKRPSEKTGCGLAFPIAGPFISFLTVTIVGVMMGLFLQSMAYSNKDFWLYFGVVAGCIIMHCIMQMVLQMNFRAFFHNRLSMVICTAFAVVFMCVFRFDLTGYDTYLPSEDELDSVGVSISELEYYRNYVKEYTQEEYEKLINQNVVFSSTYSSQEQCAMLSQMNLKNVQPVLRLAEKAIQEKNNEENFGTMTVCYRLKNGRCVYRSYDLTIKDNFEACSEIFAMDRYKESLYPVLTKGEENCPVWLNNGFSENKKKLTLDDTQYITLLRTYKRELKDLDLETMRSEEPILLLEFTRSQNDYYNSYPVYPSFQHTLTLLKGYGCEPASIYDSIYKARILYEEDSSMDGDSYLIGYEDGFFEEWDESGSPSGQYNTYWTEDQEQLDELRPYLISAYFSNCSLTLKDEEPGYYVTAYMTDEETGEEMVSEFFIEKGKVPDFLQKLKTGAQQNVG
ncbi:MAG: DUF6449 domain-containing protein [Lachnospiraceae bacterium]